MNRAIGALVLLTACAGTSRSIAPARTCTSAGATAVRDVADAAPSAGRWTPPAKLSGPDPAYTAEAIAAHVEGIVVAVCVLDAAGTVSRCRIERGLPHMDAAVLAALEARRYRPALLDGCPVAVNYRFRITMRFP